MEMAAIMDTETVPHTDESMASVPLSDGQVSGPRHEEGTRPRSICALTSLGQNNWCHSFTTISA